MKLLFSAIVSSVLIPTVVFAADEPLTLEKTIELKGVSGKLDHLAVDTKGQRLFLANQANNTLDIVDLKTGKLIKQVADQGKISGVAYASDLEMIYVGNGSGHCNGFDGKEYKQVFSTEAKDADNVHYHSGNKMVYVGQGTNLSEIDAKSGSLKTTMKLPGSVHGFKIDKKGGKIYCVLTKPNAIAIVDIAKHEVSGTMPLTLSDAGSPIAMDATNGLLFVGCPKKKPMVIIFDIKSGKELTSVAIPAGVDDVHFDSKRNRIYASCADGILAVIEKKADKYEVVSKIETPKNSRTSTWGGNKIYLGVPKQEGKEGPEIRVFAAKPVIEAKKK